MSRNFMRATVWLAFAALVQMVNFPAYAGLIGTGTNTVDAQFFLGTHDAAGLEDEGTKTITNPGGAQFPDGALSESRIFVADTTITIINDITAPYCLNVTSTGCSDSFTGFEFRFSSGVDITGVTVDSAGTSTSMTPVALNLVNPQDILVNMTGDSPNAGDPLVLDVTTAGGGGGTTGVPEPPALAIFGTGLAALFIARRRKIREDLPS